MHGLDAGFRVCSFFGVLGVGFMVITFAFVGRFCSIFFPMLSVASLIRFRASICSGALGFGFFMGFRAAQNFAVRPVWG